MPTFTYKCPNCDGGLIFDPETQRFECEYCNSLFTREQLESQPGDQNVGEEDTPKNNDKGQEEEFSHTAEYVCPSCGAEVVVDETTAATYCFYCHNPVVLSGRMSGKFRPERVIPFQITRKEVEEKFVSWCKKKKFMKKDFFSQSQQEKLTGVYLPFWLVNCRTIARLRAKGNRVRTWRSGDMQYTETEEYDLIREGEIQFSELPFAALNRKEMELTRGIAPYRFQEAEDFTMAYLSGFQAEKRNLESSDLKPQAQSQVGEYSRKLLQETISGYTGVSVREMRHSILADEWKYTLLPVWALTYRYKEKSYYFAMNRQTGKVCGEVPLSWGRLAVLAAVVSAVAFGIFLIGGWLL